MPDLGKATYTLIFDTREGEAAVAGIEERADVASRNIQVSMGNAERSVSTLGATATEAGAQVDEAATTMTGSMQEAGAAGEAMGAEISAGAATAGKAMQASAAKSTTMWASASKKMGSIAGRMKSIGRGMTHWITLPTALLAGLATKAALDYNEQITMLQTQAGATGKETEYMNEQILKLAASGKVTHGPNELAKALYHLESVGIKGKDAINALTQADHLATVGHANLEDSTNSLIGAMTTGIKGFSTFGQAVGIVNATVGAGNLRMDEFNASMTTGVLKTAALAGVTFQELGASLAEFTSQRLPAVQSMTAMKMSLTQLQKPTTQQIRAMQKLGYTQGKLGKDGLEIAALIQKKGLIPVMGQLRDRYEALVKRFGKQEANKVLLAAFGGAKSAKAMLALVTGADDLKKKYEQIQEKSMSFAQLTAKAMGEPVNKMRKDMAQLGASFVKIGQKIVPVVTKIVNGITHLFQWFEKLSPKTQKWILLLIGAAAVLGPLLGLLGTFVGIIAAIVAAPVVFGVIGAVLLLGGAFVLLYIKVKKFRQIVNAVFHWIKAHWKALATWLVATNPFVQMALFAYVIIRHYRAVWKWLKAFWHAVTMMPQHPIKAMVAFFHLGVQAIKGAFSSLPGFVKSTMASLVNIVIGAINYMIGLISKIPFPTIKVHKHLGIPVPSVHMSTLGQMAGFGDHSIGDVHWGGGSRDKSGAPSPEDSRAGGVSAGRQKSGRGRRHRTYNPGSDPRLGDVGGSYDMPGNLDLGTPKKPKKKKKGKGAGTSAADLLGPEWMHLQDRLLRAETTKTKKDDRSALEAQQRFLKHLLAKPGLGEKKRHAALQALVSVKRQLESLNKTASKTEKNTRAQVQAMQDMRATFFDQFASNIFHRNASGKLEVGGTKTHVRHAHVEQHNTYHEIPKDRYVHARRMRRAMQGALD